MAAYNESTTNPVTITKASDGSVIRLAADQIKKMWASGSNTAVMYNVGNENRSAVVTESSAAIQTLSQIMIPVTPSVGDSHYGLTTVYVNSADVKNIIANPTTSGSFFFLTSNNNPEKWAVDETPAAIVALIAAEAIDPSDSWQIGVWQNPTAAKSMSGALQLVQQTFTTATSTVQGGNPITRNVVGIGVGAITLNGAVTLPVGSNTPLADSPTEVTIHNGSSNAKVVFPNATGGQNIDGSSSLVLPGQSSVKLVFGNGAWRKAWMVHQGEAIFNFFYAVLSATGTTQGTAAAIGKEGFISVTSVTTLLNGVILELLATARNGREVTIYNSDSGDVLNVYPASGEAIGAYAANRPVQVPPLGMVTIAEIGTTWQIKSFATSGGFVSPSTTGLTAHAGGGQALATAITTQLSNFTVVGTDNDSAQLPAAVEGGHYWVTNADGAQSMNVYPINGGTDQIDGLGANNPVSIPSGNTTVHFWCQVTGSWESDLDQFIRNLIAENATISTRLTTSGSRVIHRRAPAYAANVAILATDEYVAMDTSGGATQADLVDVSTVPAGFVLIIKDRTGNAGANNLTIDGSAAQTIDGAATLVINTNFSSRTLIGDGVSNWEVN